MQISPSILGTDFTKLGQTIELINKSKASMVHLDVMDGVFVPNISFGFPVIKSISYLSEKPLDVHLMIQNPQNYVSQVRDSGAAIMNIHQEASLHLHRTIQAIKAAGMKAGVTLNPSTPVVMLEDVIQDVDMVLIMSVNPGFGGQKFIPGSIDKIVRLRKMIDTSGSNALIQVDGGVNLSNASILAKAGADIVVAGNSVFTAPNPLEAINALAAIEA